MKNFFLRITYSLLLSTLSANVFAEKYNIAVQPVLPPEQIKLAYQPLT